MTSHTPKYFFTAMRERLHEKSISKAEAGAAYEVYPLKKDGTPYSSSHVNHAGRSKWTAEEAQAEADRMAALNPGRKYIVKEA